MPKLETKNGNKNTHGYKNTFLPKKTKLSKTVYSS